MLNNYNIVKLTAKKYRPLIYDYLAFLQLGQHHFANRKITSDTRLEKLRLLEKILRRRSPFNSGLIFRLQQNFLNWEESGTRKIKIRYCGRIYMDSCVTIFWTASVIHTFRNIWKSMIWDIWRSRRSLTGIWWRRMGEIRFIMYRSIIWSAGLILAGRSQRCLIMWRRGRSTGVSGCSDAHWSCLYAEAGEN